MFRKNLTTLVLVAVCLAVCFFAGTAATASDGAKPASAKTTTDEKTEALKTTLVDLEMRSWQAWKDRDGRYFDGFLSDDHIELGASGRASKSQVVNFVGSPICVVKSYSVTDMKMTQLNDSTALLTYHVAQDTTCNGQAVPSPAWTSSLFAKRNGKWLNVLYQQTPAPK